jgi:hypothetical protein
MLCAMARNPALAAAKCAKPGRPRKLAEAPVKMIGLASREKTAEATDPPEFLEGLRPQLAKIQAPVVAGVVDDEIGGIEAGARRHRPIEQPHDVSLARHVRDDRLGAAARRPDGACHLLDFLARAAGDEHVMSLPAEPPAECRAEAALCADPDNHGCWLRHMTAPS